MTISRINRSFCLSVHTHVWTHVDIQRVEKTESWGQSSNPQKNENVHQWMAVIMQDDPHHCSNSCAIKLGTHLKEKYCEGGKEGEVMEEESIFHLT